MDLINFFILIYKIDFELKDKLILLFKSFIKSNKSLNYNNLNSQDQVILEKGSYSSFQTIELLEILINSNLENQFDDNGKLKEILITIKNTIHNEKVCIFNKHHSLNLLNELNELLNQLSTILLNSSSSSQQQQQQLNPYGDSINNFKNEKAACDLKEIGNREYDKKNFSEAMLFYKRALSMDNISNYTQSLLLLNCAATLFELSFQQVYDTIINGYEVYDLINHSCSKIVSALSCRYNWSKAYFKYGKITTKMGLYNQAIDAYNAVIELENNETQTPNSSTSTLKKESKELINKLNIKLKSSRVYYQDDSKKDKVSRDFKKETINQINYMNDGTIKFISKNLNVSKNFIKTHLKYGEKNNIIGSQMVNAARKLDLPIELIYEVELKRKIVFYSNFADREILREFCLRMIGSNTLLAYPYMRIALWTMCNCASNCGGLNYLGEVKKNECIMSLLLNASNLPLSLYDNDKNQYYYNEYLSFIITSITRLQKQDVLAAHCNLASIYKFAKFGQDYDVERAIYHLEFINSNLDENNQDDIELYKSILHANEIKCPFFSLGQMYYFGKTSFTAPLKDKVKAKKLFIKGSKFGSEFCIVYLHQYFKNDDSIEVVEILNNNSINNDPYLKLQINDKIGLEIALEDGTEMNRDIDFKNIISLSKKGKSQFTSFLHSTTLIKIQSFLQSFTKFEKQQKRLLNGNQLISPPTLDDKLKSSNVGNNGIGNEMMDVFLYLTLSVVKYLDYNNLKSCVGGSGGNDHSTIKTIIEQRFNEFILRSPIDSPYLAESYFNMSLLLIKLSNGIGAGERKYDNEIKKYYQLGCKVKNLVISLIHYHKLEKSFNLIKDQLLIHFGTINFD